MICLDQFQYPLVSNLRASCVIQLTIFTKVASRVRGFTRELPCIERTYYKSIVFFTFSRLHSSNTTFAKVQGTIQSLSNLNFSHLHLFSSVSRIGPNSRGIEYLDAVIGCITSRTSTHLSSNLPP